MANISLTNNPLVNYVRNSKDELKKVTWPTRQRVIRDTSIVVAISLGMAIFFSLADKIFDIGFQKLIS
ncbi:MAG: preprotein translocase subunit SecE [Patescibacteria group bacterium]|nr:preprotein translocase subunit SecE [Patescibacteria group bacterium]